MRDPDRPIAAPAPTATGARELIARLGLHPHPEGGWYRELHRSETTVQRHGDGRDRAGLTLIAYLLCRGERSRWHRVRNADEIWHHGAGAPLDLWCLPPEGGTARLLGLGALTGGGGRTPRDRSGDGPRTDGLGADRPAEAEPGAEALIKGDPISSGPGHGDPAGEAVAQGGGVQRGPGGAAPGAEEAGCRAAEGDAPVRVIAAHWWQAARSRGEWSLVYCTVGPGFSFEDFELLADHPASQRPTGATLELI